jgi:hypothetical protein
MSGENTGSVRRQFKPGDVVRWASGLLPYVSGSEQERRYIVAETLDVEGRGVRWLRFEGVSHYDDCCFGWLPAYDFEPAK